MRYQKLMKKVMEQLAEYKGIIDSLTRSYLAEKQKHEEELQKMQGRYTPEYIEENRRNWAPDKDYGKLISAARDKYQKNAAAYLDRIKTEIDGYFRVPVDSGFAATVTAVKSLGVTLNDREFEVLQDASGGYWGLRLLNELGVARTKTKQGAELEDGEARRVEKEVGMPYSAVRLPDIEKAYNSLRDMENSVNMAFEAYCGEGYALKDYVFPLSETAKKTKANLAAEYGIEPPKQGLDILTISKMASAEKCFDESHSAYTEFSEMMGSLEVTMPKPKRKETLTDGDKKLIDTLIDSRYESLAKEQAVQIAKADGRLAEILRLDERYGAAVKEVLEGGGENE